MNNLGKPTNDKVGLSWRLLGIFIAFAGLILFFICAFREDPSYLYQAGTLLSYLVMALGLFLLTTPTRTNVHRGLIKIYLKLSGKQSK